MKKAVITAVALTLALCLAVGGTLAYLMDQTDPVVNTFTAGDVEVTLEETLAPDGSALGDNEWKAQMVPGNSYYKDPTVSVSGNVDCYLFVKFEQGSADTYLNYTSTLTETNGWKLVPNETDVWYREVGKNDVTKSWVLLKADESGKAVTVDGEAVNKENMTQASAVSLKYTAYAAQKDNLTVEEAWKLF